MGNQQGIAASLNNIARLKRLQGDVECGAEDRHRGRSVVTWPMQGIAFSLGTLGLIAQMQRDGAIAERSYTGNPRPPARRGQSERHGVLLLNLGLLAHDHSDDVAAHRFIAESLALNRNLGDKQGIAYALYHLGLLAHDQRDDAAAQHYLIESLALNRDIGHKVGIAIDLWSGPTRLYRGDFVRHRTSMLKVLRSTTRLGQGRNSRSLGCCSWSSPVAVTIGSVP